MTIPNELKSNIEKYILGIITYEELEALLIAYKDREKITVQVAKYINNIQQVQNSQIGDRIIQSRDEDTKELLRKIYETVNRIDIEKSIQKNDQITLPSSFSPQTTNEKFTSTNYLQQQLIPPAPPTLTSFEFEVVTVNAQGRETKRSCKQAEYFTENLGDEVVLSMISIPDGKFQMGAPKDEEASLEDERPQHLVTIKPFFMSKYPITQAQWRAIATKAKIKCDLKPDPSYFKGDNLPVERVSWHDAQEFCARLSRKTGRTYRLPSEAEWEYACRARTITPFHFGETITTNLSNYCGQDRKINRRLYKGTYGDEPYGVNRQQTTEVDSFPVNAFGLCDMHGNVWEWCADNQHQNYQGSPSDGSIWVNEENSESRISRGGCWNSPPQNCRSAFRSFDNPSNSNSQIGFRVVCSFFF